MIIHDLNDAKIVCTSSMTTHGDYCDPTDPDAAIIEGKIYDNIDVYNEKMIVFTCETGEDFYFRVYNLHEYFQLVDSDGSFIDIEMENYASRKDREQQFNQELRDI